MLKLNSKKILLLLLGIFIFLIFFKFFSILSFPDSETILDKGKELKIFPDQAFHQTFVANRDNLNKIEFLLRTPGIKAGDIVTVLLTDATCTTTLRQGTLEASFLNSDNLYVAQFPRIEDSNGKKYCTIVSYQTTNAKTKYLRFFTTENQNREMTLTHTNGEITKNQSLSLRLVYNNDSVWQDLRELNQRISQYKPWFLKHFYIAAIAVLFIFLSLTLIIALITLDVKDKRD